MNEDDASSAVRAEVATAPEEPAAEETGAEETLASGHVADTCPVAWCPFCLAVGAVQPLRPEVVDHLLKAGTELLLAFRGVLDARADEVAKSEEPAPATTLEKIDLG